MMFLVNHLQWTKDNLNDQNITLISYGTNIKIINKLRDQICNLALNKKRKIHNEREYKPKPYIKTSLKHKVKEIL